MPSEAFTFETATKDQAKARIALDGPSGSGKTWTALTLATAFGGEFAVIDTERGSASKYAGPFQFKRLNLTRYDPGDMPAILAAAAAQGFETVVIDSLSKFWSGIGGMLERVDNSGRRKGGGNQFAGWKEERPVEAAMIEAMCGFPGHVIVTMRVKTAYDINTNDQGKKVPVKIGLKPEQREGLEYEFDIVGDMDLDNTLTISKTRCPALAQAVIRKPGHEVAETILEWLAEGAPVTDASGYRDMVLAEADPGTLRDLYREVKARGLYGAAVIDGTGETVTLGELIIQRGKDVATVRPAAELPRNANGAIARSLATDPELAAAGLMTAGQLKEHTALGGGHPGEHKTAKPDRAKVTRIDGDPDARAPKAAVGEMENLLAKFPWQGGDKAEFLAWNCGGAYRATRGQVAAVTAYLQKHLEAAQGDAQAAVEAIWQEYRAERDQAAQEAAEGGQEVASDG